MTNSVKQDTDFPPSALPDEDMYEGFKKLEAYQAQFVPAVPYPNPRQEFREIALYEPFDHDEPRHFPWALGVALAFGLSFATVLWFSRGTPGTQSAAIAQGPGGGDKFVALSASADAPVPVTVQTSQAVRRDQVLTVRGKTEAAARVAVKAEAAGVVEAIGAPKGTQVRKGDLLCAMARGAREASLAEARARLSKAKLAFNSNGQFSDRAAGGKNQPAGNKPSPASLKASLAAAEAAVKKAEVELGRTRITAPFAGVVEEQPAKVGERLAAGSPCAVLLALNPLYIVGSVPERDVGRLANGMKGTGQLVTGETVAGSLDFVAAAASANTRTFRVELKVPNPDGKLRDGVTAAMRIPVGGEPAHMLSPSSLTVNDAGQLGVRVVEPGETARFLPVKVLGRDERDAVWVGGLPKSVNVIVAGQNSVADGQRVEVAEKREAQKQ